MQNFCLLVGFLGEKAQILHTWKIQVYQTTNQGLFHSQAKCHRTGSLKTTQSNDSNHHGGICLVDIEDLHGDSGTK